MIDRRTFWTVMGFVAMMLAMAAVAVLLLPDWTRLPRYDLNGAPLKPVSSIVLLIPPAMMLFTMARLVWRGRTAKNPGAALQRWRKWAGTIVMCVGVMLTLMQAFTIARALGFASLMNSALFTRGSLVALGLMVTAINNNVSKLPWLESKIAFLNLDPDRGAEFLRFRAWAGFLIGLATVLTGLFLPLAVFPPLIFAMAVSVVAMGWIFRISARRRQPQ